MHPALHLDHILTYTNAPSIDLRLDAYRSAGFQVAKQTARHGGGLRNGFVAFGPEYLEMVWVEDDEAFSRRHPHMPELTRQDVRAAQRPFALGLVSPNVNHLHDGWVRRGHDLPPVFSVGPPDALAGAPPALTIQQIPSNLLPGVLVFAITYHFNAGPSRLVVPANTAYAIGGVTCVAKQPGTSARLWHDLLAPDAPMHDDVAGFSLDSHTLRWISADDYARETGRSWQHASHEYGELAMVHVLAENLDLAAKAMCSAGIPVEIIDEGPRMLVGPQHMDGFLLVVTQVPLTR